MKSYFVIMNPVSGTINVSDIKLYLKQFLKNKYELYITSGKENIPELVKKRQAEGQKIFVAIGGDGTISEVAEGIIGTTSHLAIVPTGTANNLAQELDIPLAVKDAIRILSKKYKTVAIDAMKVKNRYYFLDISIGAKSLAIKDTGRKAKLQFGIIAYIWSGLQRLIQFNPQKFTITVDGKTVKYEASEVVVANGAILGHKAFKYSQTIRIDDGILHVCIIRADTLWEYIKVGFRFFTNKHVAKEHVQFLTSQKVIHINASRDLPVQADGEIIGRRHVKVTLVPRSLHVAVPR